MTPDLNVAFIAICTRSVKVIRDLMNMNLDTEAGLLCSDMLTAHRAAAICGATDRLIQAVLESKYLDDSTNRGALGTLFIGLIDLSYKQYHLDLDRLTNRLAEIQKKIAQLRDEAAAAVKQ